MALLFYKCARRKAGISKERGFVKHTIVLNSNFGREQRFQTKQKDFLLIKERIILGQDKVNHCKLL